MDKCQGCRERKRLEMFGLADGRAFALCAVCRKSWATRIEARALHATKEAGQLRAACVSLLEDHPWESDGSPCDCPACDGTNGTAMQRIKKILFPHLRSK